MADQETMTTYGQAKHAVAALISAAQAHMESHRRERAGAAAHNLLVRLAEDHFNLAVVGQFKRGKSSLINAILGKDILPTAIVPLTSVVTTLRHGSEERVLVRCEGVPAPLILPTSSLAEYVTERGNPNNEKRVISVDVEVPASFLHRGLHLVDTPGVGSARQQNTATTYAFLPEADAVIFVTSVDSSLTEAELRFLDSVRQYAQRTFVVLNKVDQLEAGDLNEAAGYAREVIQQRLGEDGPGVFSLSAKEALAGKRSGDIARLERSGLPEFEKALTSFLATGRGKALLLATLDRARRILDEERELISLASVPCAGDENESMERSSILDEMVERLAADRERLLDRVRAGVSRWETESLEPILAEYIDAERNAILVELEARTKAEVGADLATRRERLRTWWQQALAERGYRFLLGHGWDWEVAGQMIVREAVDYPDALPSASDMERELAAMLRQAVPESPRPFTLDARELTFPAAEVAADDLLWLVQPPFAGWVFRRCVRQDLAADLTQLAGCLRDVVRGYLAVQVTRLDQDTARLLQDIRPAVAQPDAGSGKVASQPALEEQRANIEKLVSRVEELRRSIVSPDGTPSRS